MPVQTKLHGDLQCKVRAPLPQVLTVCVGSVDTGSRCIGILASLNRCLRCIRLSLDQVLALIDILVELRAALVVVLLALVDIVIRSLLALLDILAGDLLALANILADLLGLLGIPLATNSSRVSLPAFGAYKTPTRAPIPSPARNHANPPVLSLSDIAISLCTQSFVCVRILSAIQTLVGRERPSYIAMPMEHCSCLVDAIPIAPVAAN
jgi:hypothetical protein